MSDEWGPWIDHDGKGCPVPNGAAYHAIFEDGDEEFGVRGHSGFLIGGPDDYDSSDGSWIWDGDYFRIISYRIRKPKGLTILEGILADLPDVKSPEKVGGQQ